MTATAPCSRCGTQNAVGARMCVGCQAPLDESAQAAAAPPLARQLGRGLGAAVLATMISAVGALAIYLVHQTMPAVPPGFERVARVPETLPPPGSGDEARLSHLRRPEPGATVVARPETTPEPPRGTAPAPLRPASEPSGTVAAPASAEPARPQVAPNAERGAPAASAASAPAARAGDRLAAAQQAQCGSEALLARLVCNERVRLRFCRNRWNTHPDCEVGPSLNAAN